MEGKPFCTELRGWILSEFVIVISVVITTYIATRVIYLVFKPKKGLFPARATYSKTVKALEYMCVSIKVCSDE